MPTRLAYILALAFALAGPACKGEPDPTPFCTDVGAGPDAGFDAPTTYWADVKPILDSICTACHTPGGAAYFSLETYADAKAAAEAIPDAVVSRRMPPYLAARCCQTYHREWSLEARDVDALVRWVAQGAPEGDPASEPPPRPRVVGLSRVDVTVAMKEAYVPAPQAGSTDDVRCFVLDWPLAEAVYVTGLNPMPGARQIVHHLVVGYAPPDQLAQVAELDARDPGPGFDCKGALGDLRGVQIIGGSLIGGDFPADLGKQVEPGGKIILNIHYSTVLGEASDLTMLQFKVDPVAREAKSIAIANPLWLVDDGMLVEAGDPDAVFWYQFEPTLYTRGKPVDLWGVTPHMHYFGSRQVVRIVRDGGDRTCLLEIPAWHFGAEQPFWFAEPVRLEPGDELYLECHFDNSAANQPVPGTPPRDFRWGGDNQDMCAAFVAYTEVR